MPTSGTLNLILHGMFAIVQRSNEIRIVVPDFGEHRYQLGSKAPFTDYPRGALSILGLSDPARHERFSRNLCAMVENVSLNENLARNVLPLYLPQRIHARRILTRQGNLHFQPDDLLITAPAFALVEVLEYPFLDLSKVEVPGLWKANGFFQPASGRVNLHLFAEGGVHVVGSHASQAWDMMMQLVPELKLTLVIDNPSANPPSDDPTRIPGVNPDELEPPRHVLPDDCLDLVINQ